MNNIMEIISAISVISAGIIGAGIGRLIALVETRDLDPTINKIKIKIYVVVYTVSGAVLGIYLQGRRL